MTVFEVIDTDKENFIEDLGEKNLEIATLLKEKKLGVASFLMRSGQQIVRPPQQEETTD